MSYGFTNPTTSYSLLNRLRGETTRREAMREFVEKYTLFVVSRIRRSASNLQDHDVADLAQCIFASVWSGLIDQKFLEERRNFRNWFAVVIKREVLQFLRKRNAKHRGKGDLGLSDFAVEDQSLDDDTLHELERYELQRALSQVSEEVREIEWQAFQLSVYGEINTDGLHSKLSAAEVGSRLGIKAERVHAFKFKVLQRLRMLLADLDFPE